MVNTVKRINVCLDPGHVEGYNTGVVKSYTEGTKMFYLAQYIKEELLKYNEFNVSITRATIKSCPSLKARGQFAIDNHASVFISLHSNAVGSNGGTAYGNIVYRSIKRPNSIELGDLLGNNITSLMHSDIPKNFYRKLQSPTYPNNKNFDYHGVIRHAVVGNSAVQYVYLIEHGFHTTYDECNWLNQDVNLHRLAKVYADTLASYFKATPKEVHPDPIVPSEYTVYTVKRGDTLSEIASDFYHDGDMYKLIKEFNKLKSDTIRVGQSLKIPNITPVKPSNPDVGFYDYTIVEGDSFWKIAKTQMGDGAKYIQLASYNKMDVNRSIKAGTVIKIPIASAVSKKYTIKNGDSFWKIAKTQMGDGNRYRELASFNDMEVDDSIHPGDVIRIPVK